MIEVKTFQVFYICLTNSEEPHFIGRDNRVYNTWQESLTSYTRSDIENTSPNVLGKVRLTNRFYTEQEARSIIGRVKEKLAGCACRRDYEDYLKEPIL